MARKVWHLISSIAMHTDRRPAHMMSIIRPIREFDILVVLLIVLIIIVEFQMWGIGPIQGNDAGGYIGLADQLASGKIWMSVPDLETNYQPLSLLRLPGYPAVILLARSIAGEDWVVLLVAV